MLKQKKKNGLLKEAVRLALFASLTSAMVAPVAMAQDGDVEEVVVTGSSIKRVAMEGTLPVQVLTREDIDSLGVKNVEDLIQQLPSMQGFTTSSDSVGGGGGGIQTASLRDLGEQYTLVLLNGRRLAPADSGGTINLSSIPFAAIETVEVLTDGASALYGSDAIAGVVNFILKKEVDTTTVTVSTSSTQEGGGDSVNASITSGFGNLNEDGYNLTVSYSHDSQDQLKASDRDFAKTGMISFEKNGRDLYFFNGSGNAIPGNARIKYTDGTLLTDEDGNNVLDGDGNTILKEFSRTFNPYAAENGSCAPNNSAIFDECFFDYTSTIEIIPESERDSLFLQGNYKLNEDMTAFASLNLSDYSMTTRIAPYPTGWVRLPNDATIVVDNVVPHMTADELAALAAGTLTVDGRWRALPAGNRTTEWNTKSTHIVAGVEGQWNEIDFNAALTSSKNDVDQNYPTGWLLENEFGAAVSAGDIDIFAPAGVVTNIDNVVYSGNWSNQTTKLTALDVTGSKDVFEMAGGSAYLGAGINFSKNTYENSLSQANEDQVLLFLGADTAYDLERSSYGTFVELVAPVTEALELTGSLRYDNFGAVKDSLNGGNVNDSDNDVTYKLSARLQASDTVILRSSFGTGFKAPSLLDIARPRSDFGVTGATYACPFEVTDPLAAYCLTGQSQYAEYLQGNPNLKSETSEQFNFGIVFTPSDSFTAELTYWSINMEDVVTGLTEAQIFEDPELYRDLFTTRLNSSTGENELAILISSVNVGKSENSGIDWNLIWEDEMSFGTWTNRFSGTYMVKSQYTRPGTDDDWISSLGEFGDNNAVTFRVLSQFSSNIKHPGFLGSDSFSHTLTANYKSGYDDQFQSADFCSVTEVDALGDCVAIQLTVASYTTLDYQTQYSYDDQLTVTFGVNNLADNQPGLSLRTGGAGHQVAFDPRYTDSYGRTIYLTLNYEF